MVGLYLFDYMHSREKNNTGLFIGGTALYAALSQTEYKFNNK